LLVVALLVALASLVALVGLLEFSKKLRREDGRSERQGGTRGHDDLMIVRTHHQNIRTHPSPSITVEDLEL
jgi:hypothetical protein